MRADPACCSRPAPPTSKGVIREVGHEWNG
jgi:hypothetical protein